jgi:DNA-binding NtrC family response regulator
VDKLFNKSLTIRAQDSFNERPVASVKVKDLMVSCLLIGQNANESHHIAGLMAQLGVACQTLTEIEPAIRHCHENKPDVVMLDATSLPEAKEFLRLVRYQNRNTGRPVVIVYATEANVTQMADSILNGASEFMVVPFDMDLLRFKLTQSGVLLAAAA